MLADLAVDIASDAGGETVGFAVETMTPELLDAWHRMLRLLDAPDEITAMAPLVEREILFRILRGPQGSLWPGLGDISSELTGLRTLI